MALNEIFPRPLVKQVVFELRFPTLFFLEGKIGDFQIKIMQKFPQSEILLRRSMVFAMGVEAAIQNMPKPQDEGIDKIWQFKSPNGIILDLTRKSLALSSLSHTSYNLEPNSFRSCINDIVKVFIEITGLPLVDRIGLRYIDEAPVFENSTQRFKECYNTMLPLERFPVEALMAANCAVLCTRPNGQLQYVESLKSENGAFKFELDFDAAREGVESSKIMEVADSLHEIINQEFERTIKAPILEYMRAEKEKK